MADSVNDADTTQLSPTQSLSSSRARDLYDDNDVSTASEADDSHDEGFRMDIVASSVHVMWQAEGEDQARHVSELKMDAYVDTTTSTDWTALFLIRGQCTLRSGTPAAIPLFVYIYPENILSVDLVYTSALPEQGGVSDMDSRFITLRFNMTQPASLVAPKHRPLQPKERSKALVDGLHSLATVTVVSIFLELSTLAAETRAQLALLPSVFSSGRLTTPANRASLQRLYGGAGGYVVNHATTEREATLEEAQATQACSPTQACSTTQFTSGELQEPVQITTPTQTRKRSASPNGLLPPYIKHEDDSIIARGESHLLLESTEQASLSQETQPSTPSDRKKRPRLSATPSNFPSPPCLPPLDTIEAEPTTDPQTLSFIIHQLLSRNASLEKRVSQLESSTHHPPSPSHAASSPSPHTHNSEKCHQNCRYNTSEASSVRHHMDDSIEHGLDTACSKLEDWAQLEFEQQVRAEISGQLEDVEQRLGQSWAEGIREEVKEEVTQQVKGEVLEEVAREVLRRVARGVIGSLQAYLREDGKPGVVAAGSAQGGGSGCGSLPGETALYAAVRDVQERYGGEMTEEEMARVMDHLEDNPLSAVKYNACGEGMRRYFVGRWKGRSGYGGVRGWR